MRVPLLSICFLWCGTAILLSSPLLAQGSVPQTSPTPPVISPTKGYFVQEIRDGLYWITDGAYNTIFLVSTQGVIVLDPLPTLGRKYLEAIREVTSKPVTHVIYSHEHSDHIGAAYLFPRGATYIAQRETGAILARRHDPKRLVPTVTFDRSYTLTVGNQTLILDYKGVNHETGNIFIYAPRQKVLMLVDVVYPGWMPYKSLGIAEDIPGYIQAHHDALAYDFDTLVAGHVDRLGNRHDVEVSLKFVNDLKTSVSESMRKLDYPTFLRLNPSSKPKWERHNDYEGHIVEQCYGELLPRWKSELGGTESTLRYHCRAMLVALIVQYPVGPEPDTGVAKGDVARR